ncbi:DUF4440 domain-containing protein [Lactobacillus curvatus]|nr:DUF4440 domain-containing protein [Latilactobacillus curvatus]MSE24361.1 DUF4440 domain-containing protein [Latilactobacillus curvatus]
MTTETSEEKLVAEVIRQQVKGMLDGDLELLNKVIAPDAVFVHITGKQQNREQWLQQIKMGRMHYFNSDEKLMQVLITGNTAQVISRNELDARIYGFRNTWPLETRVALRKNHGQWQIIKSQASMY